jgi:hypothetical protein
MFVFNDVVHDARVRKEAASLAAAGFDVTLIGRIRERDEQLPARERIDGFTLLRVRVPRTGDTVMTAARRPWRLRRRAVDAFRRSVARPGLGWLKAAGMALGAPLVAPWIGYRAADVYLLGDRAPSPARGGTVEWLARWEFDVKGWGERAARAAPASAVWHAHDFTALPAAFAAQARHGGKVVYDSHEIYMETTRIVRLPAWARRRLAGEERAWTRRAAP